MKVVPFAAPSSSIDNHLDMWDYSYDKIMRQTFHIIGLFQITVETYRGVKAHLDVYYKDNSKWKLMGSSHSQRQRCG
ncbi:hypothetical protein Tco_0837091, partial [Tanacetum coccineum]